MGHFSFVVVFWVESKRNEMKWNEKDDDETI